MSRYFVTYLALLFCAASLAVADEATHSTEPAARAAHEVVTDPSVTDPSSELDVAQGISLVDALENAEKSLGKRRSTGEVVEPIEPVAPSSQTNE